MTRAARDVRIVKLIHLALLALGMGQFALALLLRVLLASGLDTLTSDQLS